MKTWTYIMYEGDGRPKHGSFSASSTEEAQKRLVAMGLPNAKLESVDGEPVPSTGGGEHVAMSPKEPPVEDIKPPTLVEVARLPTPADVAEKISNIAKDISPKKVVVGEKDDNHLQKDRRQRILFGDPKTILPIADQMLSCLGNEVVKMQMLVDGKGVLQMALVVSEKNHEDS